LFFGWNSSCLRLFQHFMSLTYEHEMCFLYLGMNIFFLFHCDLHLLKMLNTKLCSPHYVCIMWKETIKRINGPKKKKMYYFPLCFSYVFNFLVTKLFWYVFLIIWLNASHYNYIMHILWYQPIYTFTIMFLMAWFLLLHMCDDILWIMYLWNSHLTFFIPKINIQQNWIRIYECLEDKFCMQNVILSLLHDCIHNMNK